jgi:putative MFS transporter
VTRVSSMQYSTASDIPPSQAPTIQALPGQAPSRTIAARLDALPLTFLHMAILALCTLGLSADIGEVALSNTFSVLFLAPPYHASHSEVSLLLGSIFAGGAIGAPAFGWWADQRGRRATLQIALAVLVASSLAVAASPNIAAMTAFRFVSGLALGAYPPLTAAYLSDVLPPRRRGLLMMLCAAFAFLGAPALIFLIRWLTPLAPFGIEGWRWALIAGAGIAAATFLLFFLVPESPRWLAALGREAKADDNCTRFETAARQSQLQLSEPQPDPASQPKTAPDLIASNRTGRVVLLCALYALAPWASVGFPLLSATVLVHKGFHTSDSLLFAALSMFGPTIGITIAALFIDRIERRIALMLCAIGMAAFGLIFAVSSDLSALIGFGNIFNLASAIYSAILALYGAELFPTSWRATATAGAWGIGRIVSAFVPIVLLPLLTGQGVLAMFGVIATALVISAFVLLAGPPGLARRPVE